MITAEAHHNASVLDGRALEGAPIVSSDVATSAKNRRWDLFSRSQGNTAIQVPVKTEEVRGTTGRIYMPLIKIPCILVATIGFHVSVTPPNPPPSKSEYVGRPTLWEFLILSKSARAIAKAIIWTIGVGEIVAILANQGIIRLPAMSRKFLGHIMDEEAPNPLRLAPASLVGVGLLASGTLLRLWCYRTMGRFFTFPRTMQPGHRLITSGPYRFVRHPSYTGLTMMYCGMVLWYGSRGSLLRESGVLDTYMGRTLATAFAAQRLATVIVLVSRMPKEDMALRREFGHEWDDWARRVPWRLIPGMF